MLRKGTLLMLLLLAGCATNSQLRRPEHLNFPIAPTINAEVRLMQHQMLVSHANSTVGGAVGLQLASSPSVAAGGFGAGAAVGLVGVLVDAAIEAHRSGVADDAVKPMRNHMVNLNLDDLVYQSMDGLDKQVFAPNIELERLNQSEDENQKARTLKAGANILVLLPSYSVSYDGQSFTYVLAAKIVDRGVSTSGWMGSTIKYQQLFEYVVTKDSLSGGVDWSALSSEQWKSLIVQAASETVQMLNYDIAATPGKALPKVSYGRLSVSVDQTKGDRSWVRTNFGILLSLSSASLTAKDH